MKSTLILAATALMFAATQAYAAGGHCHEDMAAISAAMSKAKLTDADAAKVKAALAKGEELHKAGKEDDCRKAIGAAQKLVGIQDKH